MTFALRYAARSDLGLGRSDNQDSLYAGPHLLAIADGMGGAVGGAVASSTVISAVQGYDDLADDADLVAELGRAVDGANGGLKRAIDARPELRGMGTTLTALLFDGERIGLAHVGDSRSYLARGGEATQITRDHSFVQALVDEGKITAEAALTHPWRSRILRALMGSPVEADIELRDVQLGDRYLICSDGLTDYVGVDTVTETMAVGDPEDAVDRLIELALRGGGGDNITIVIADVVDADDPTVTTTPVIAGAVTGDDSSVVEPNSPAARAAITIPPRRRRQAAQPVAQPAAGPPADHADGDGDGDGDTDSDTDSDADSDADGDRPPQHRSRRWRWLSAAMLVVVLAGVFGVYAWTQTQYLVRADGDTIVLDRGVNVSIGGLHLYHRVQTTGLRITDLVPVARAQVRNGISVGGRPAANNIVSNLRRNQLLPVCPSPTPSGPPPSSAPAPSGSPSASPSGSPSGSPTHPSGPTRRSGSPSASGASAATTHPSTPAPSGSHFGSTGPNATSRRSGPNGSATTAGSGGRSGTGPPTSTATDSATGTATGSGTGRPAPTSSGSGHQPGAPVKGRDCR